MFFLVVFRKRCRTQKATRTTSTKTYRSSSAKCTPFTTSPTSTRTSPSGGFSWRRTLGRDPPPGDVHRRELGTKNCWALQFLGSSTGREAPWVRWPASGRAPVRTSSTDPWPPRGESATLSKNRCSILWTRWGCRPSLWSCRRMIRM